MTVNTSISISQIGNGYVVADAMAGLCGDSEWNFADSIFYPDLDALGKGLPEFAMQALTRADARAKELKELKEQQRQAGEGGSLRSALNNPQSQARGAIIGRPY